MKDQRHSVRTAVEAQFNKENFFKVYVYMKGLLDFDKSMKNPKARYFMRSKFPIALGLFISLSSDRLVTDYA